MASKFFGFSNLVFVGVFLFVGLVGWNVYSYFFDTTTPAIVLSGLDIGGYYCGDVQCAVSSTKKGELAVWLDGQPLLSKFKIGSKNTDHPFTIPTRTIANGEHVLRVEVADSSFNKNKVAIDRVFNVDNQPLQAAFVKADADYKVLQGRTLHLQFQVNKPIKEAKVHALSHSFDCFAENPHSLIYECFILIACEENPNEYLFNVEIVDNVGNVLNLDNKFQIVMYPFKTQNLQIGKEKIEEEKKLGLAISERERVLQELADQSPKQKMWKGSFCTPINIARTTCDFGTIRTTQEKGRYKHKALDVANTPKSVVWSTQDGVVVHKARYEDAGNTVVVDHGYGVLSLFYHLDDFANIEIGQKIAQGSPIGTLGKTGYATGYHLHWEMRVNNIAVDPMQ